MLIVNDSQGITWYRIRTNTESHLCVFDCFSQLQVKPKAAGNLSHLLQHISSQKLKIDQASSGCNGCSTILGYRRRNVASIPAVAIHTGLPVARCYFPTLRAAWRGMYTGLLVAQRRPPVACVVCTSGYRHYRLRTLHARHELVKLSHPRNYLSPKRTGTPRNAPRCCICFRARSARSTRRVCALFWEGW